MSTVVLHANIFTDQVEDKFCPSTCPQVGTSLSGSTISSSVQTGLEKKTPQGTVYSEKTRSVQNQIIINSQQEEGNVENEFCSITPPQVGTSLSGSRISSTVQARSEKKTPQGSLYSEKTRSVQNQMIINPQQEEEKSSDGEEIFQSFQEDKRTNNT